MIDLDALSEGDELPAFERLVDFDNWNRYAAVNDEFVPIHMDDEAGREAGYPTAFGMGNLHVAYLHALVRDWLGDAGTVQALTLQYRRPSTRGVTNRARGVVRSIVRGPTAATVELEVWVEDGDAVRLTPGTMTVLIDEPERR